MLNFYIYTGGFATDVDCDAQLPANFNVDVPFADVKASIAYSGRGCAHDFGPPSTFYSRTEAHRGETCGFNVMHEFGHAFFKLTDEYCGCTGYSRSGDTPNVWTSLGDCENAEENEGWTLGTCREITGCSTRDCNDDGNADGNPDLWRYDRDTPNPDIMTAGCSGNHTYKEADIRRMQSAVLDWYYSNTKGILVEFNINDGVPVVQPLQL